MQQMINNSSGGTIGPTIGVSKNTKTMTIFKLLLLLEGSQYHPSHHQQQGYGPGAQSKTMCRMPIDPNDPQLGQVYMEDNSRPKEIVWACEYHEVGNNGRNFK